LPESKNESESKKILREKIASLPPLPNLDDSWTKHRNSLRNDILTSDPRTFLSWECVQYTMFHQSRIAELEELKRKSYWNNWQNSLLENSAGTPRKYRYLKTSSGNLIHHAYSLAKLKDYTDIDFSKLKTIVEFGGGYGSMARLAHNLGFRGAYIIFDLPEFLALQEYFLGIIGIKNVIYTDTLEKLAEALRPSDGNIDLLIATWSLSEAPLDLREKFSEKIASAKNFLISYQNSFEDIDNVAYFKKFADERKEILWKSDPINHLPGNNYLIGKL
jgi:hypothetical protein